MLPRPTYFILLTLCWLYALLRGGTPERVGTTIMVVGSALTLAAIPSVSYRFGSVELTMVLVDVTGFVACVMLALRADRFWPIWVSAFAGLGVLGHLGQWYAGAEVTPWAYGTSLIVWSYPMLAALVIGTFNQQRLATEPIAPRARA